jgi:hypothetical protein
MMPRVRFPHPLPGLALAATLACLAPAAPAAAAAELTTDARCYAQGAPLRMTASGLTPGAPLTVSLDGQALRYRDGSTPTADAAGAFASSFATPVLAPGMTQLRHALAVADGTQRARARFTVTRPAGADFAPSHGNPRTLRARFTLWGFALASGRNARAWLHWVSPAGAERRTALLGVTRGDCGTLATAPRRVFPFDAEPGRWTLVIDAHRRYRVQSDGPRAKIPVHVRAISI